MGSALEAYVGVCGRAHWAAGELGSPDTEARSAPCTLVREDAIESAGRPGTMQLCAPTPEDFMHCSQSQAPYVEAQALGSWELWSVQKQ